MAYKFLVQHLWPVADGAQVFLRREWGLGTFTIEEKAEVPVESVPTLQVQMPDHHLLWVEVSDSPYPKHLDAIVLDCINHAIPVRILVAVPAGQQGGSYTADLSRARQKGVGVVTIKGNTGVIVSHPLSMSLAGLTPIPRANFPAKYRYKLSQAESTFREGNPRKGCDDLYSIIEDLSRKIAEKTYKRGYWRVGSNPPRFERDPWAAVLNGLITNLDTNKCRLFHNNVLHRVLGVTPLRNEEVHIPRSKKVLTNSNREQRTRFEDATNLLSELIKASRTL